MPFFEWGLGIDFWQQSETIALSGCGGAIFLKLEPMNYQRGSVAVVSVDAYFDGSAVAIRERAASRAPVAGTSLPTFPRPKGGMPL